MLAMTKGRETYAKMLKDIVNSKMLETDWYPVSCFTPVQKAIMYGSKDKQTSTV